MIEITGVSKVYNRSGIKAVDGLNLTVQSGEIFGFIGPNGAGKTTTIKMMVGLLEPTAGSIKIDGYDIRSNAIEAKRRIAYVPDNPDVYEKLRGIEYLNFIADVYDVPIEHRQQRISYLLDTFEMSDAVGDLIQSYSHGMRQKIVLIGALLHDPSVWILDEPMVGLDPHSSFQLKEMMRRHCDEGHTVFFSTHVLEVAERLCDRIGIINKGRLVACGTLDELRHGQMDESLEQLFLQLTEEGAVQ
ncbi:ABC transporter ATP-binding protein [Mahella australiensis]|uniref:ABC transporter related protein n=1 Tax=Mahella australiensis (strain DSM 15567 / CIP 107919 / 50-1 BON) TaxID=697281 RepID=F3ZZ67_MAHA5|nr:ABC transporter ATP-binding protein [Mahella australiensis]AEE97849.1 ABC transporter related protein [Mahella australiensis 50-1 BON]